MVKFKRQPCRSLLRPRNEDEILRKLHRSRGTRCRRSYLISAGYKNEEDTSLTMTLYCNSRNFHFNYPQEVQSFSCDQPKASGKCTFHKHFARFRAPLEAKAGTGINAKSKVGWKNNLFRDVKLIME